MSPSALRGAVAFLTRLPVPHDEGGWDAFRTAPWTFPVVGYLAGALAAVAFVLPLPAPTAALAFVGLVYLVCGVNHLDGVADLADAAVVHGDQARRREVLKDTTVGVGGTAAVAFVVVGLALAGLGLAGLSVLDAVVLVVVVEVGAKTGLALLACTGTATHKGLGSALTAPNDRGDAVGPVVLALPALLIPVVSPPLAVAAPAALLGALAGTALVARWANARLGGVSGDVFGASNELARLAGLHLGVVAWTLW